jgi:hypothetical protein
MRVNKYLDPLYSSFGKGWQISVYINSKTSVDLDSTSLGTLGLDFDRGHGLQIQVDGQSGIKYPSS